jgi:large subunit ribosomal protein L21
VVKDKNESAYAIIQSGGKQYFVREGDTIDVELIDAEVGASVEFPVLFLNDGSKATVGAPNVKGAVVVAELIGASQGPKVTSVKYKRSHHQYRKFGHRQKYSRFKIKEISGSAKKHH